MAPTLLPQGLPRVHPAVWGCTTQAWGQSAAAAAPLAMLERILLVLQLPVVRAWLAPTLRAQGLLCAPRARKAPISLALGLQRAPCVHWEHIQQALLLLFALRAVLAPIFQAQGPQSALRAEMARTMLARELATAPFVVLANTLLAMAAPCAMSAQQASTLGALGPAAAPFATWAHFLLVQQLLAASVEQAPTFRE